MDCDGAFVQNGHRLQKVFCGLELDDIKGLVEGFVPFWDRCKCDEIDDDDDDDEEDDEDEEDKLLDVDAGGVVMIEVVLTNGITIDAGVVVLAVEIVVFA